MSAYSTAARLLPGSHLPLLFIGRAYAGMSNFPLAIKYLESAKAMCGEFERSRPDLVQGCCAQCSAM